MFTPEVTGARRLRLFRSAFLIAAAALMLCRCGSRPLSPQAPPNEPGKLSLKGRAARLRYAGRDVFAGEIAADSSPFDAKIDTFREGGKISQVLLLASKEGKVRLTGTVLGSPESFACEADRRPRGPIAVRHASGLSGSLLNRAVYDRRSDWVVSVDAGPRARVRRLGNEAGARAFGFEAEGGEIVLRFRPCYYRVHRGLGRFEPRGYRIWPAPVCGWTSWFAFFDKVTEDDIIRTADVLGEVLRPFGYKVLQVDDGYQKGEGPPELWLNTNEKFPHGLAFLAGAIRGRGLTPGIWTNVAFKPSGFVEAHPQWFVSGPDGRPALGNWIGYSLDASSALALDAVVKPVYAGLRDMGWGYYKVDALRHLRYEGYNAEADYFRRRKADLEGTYRRYVETIRGELGRDVYLLGCWGIRPELIGLIDGCRIGTDGFSYAGLAQFNSWNNVVWRNDPDHIQLDENRYRSTLVTTLTGSVLLLTDKPEVYGTGAVEAAKRTAPVLWTQPGQIFDLDPSRSGALDRVATEVSGSGPRVFDAGLTPACDLFSLEVNRPFEDWLVLGRTGESVTRIAFEDVGLDPRNEYYVFEFWSKRLLGSFSGGFAPGPLDPVFRSEALIIRERRPHPQILATSRHVTGGGVDLLDARWEGGVLSGRSRLVGGDPYTLFLAVPPGMSLQEFRSGEAVVTGTRLDNPVLEITLLAGEDAEVFWSARFVS